MTKIFAVLIILFGAIVLFSAESDPLPVEETRTVPETKNDTQLLSNKQENSTIRSQNKKRKREKVDSNISLILDGDRDVLMENNLTLTAVVEQNISTEGKEENSSLSNYAYLWTIDGNIVDTQKSITTQFTLGEHNVSCTVMNKNTYVTLIQSSINVSSWRYKEIKHIYYADETGGDIDFSYTSVYNHKNNIVLRKSGERTTEISYDEKGLKREETVEFVSRPTANKSMNYSYTEANMMSTIEEYDYEGSLVYSQHMIYDEDNNIIDYHLEFPQVEELTEEAPVYYEESNTSYKEENYIEQDVLRFDEKERLIYQKSNYGEEIIIQEYEYNEEGQKATEKHTFIHGEDVTERYYTNTFNKQGQRVTQEEKILNNNVLSCHRMHKKDYRDSAYQLNYEESEVFDGICGYEQQSEGKIRKEYNYNKKGEMLDTKVITYDGDERGEVRTVSQRLISYYNELE